MPHLITLTGPSQAGKSTTIELFKENKSDLFKPISIPKFTTRKGRKDDSPDEVIICKSLPVNCNLCYQQYDDRYGINSKDITKSLSEGYSPIIVINDVRTISEIKRIFGRLSINVFIYREPPDIDAHRSIALSRNVDDESEIIKRLKKAEAIYRIYIENIYLFNHVIVNNRSREELSKQVQSIVASSNNELNQKLFL